MRSRLSAATAAALLITASPLLAQWPAHPSKFVPLKADGTPNLEAPTPRTPDGKPDLTGVWLNEVTDADLIEFICAENERDVAHMVGK